MLHPTSAGARAISASGKHDRQARPSDHRVKNLFVITSSTIKLQARTAGTVLDLPSA